MSHALLHVVAACVHTQAEAEDAVRLLRRAAPVQADEARTMLLFCDLPDADAPKLPSDDLLIRTLQSGVMSMAKAGSCRILLLVRSRVRQAALRLYAGVSQTESPRQVVADLLAQGRTQTRFDAATFSPASLKGAYAAVLFSDLSLACTPDTPARMLEALSASRHGCVCAAVLPRREYPHSALSRLFQIHPSGFSLSPIRAAQLDALHTHKLSPGDAPMLCRSDALLSAVSTAFAAPLAPGCVFVRRKAPVLRDCFAAYRRRLLHLPLRHAALPPLQLALLFFCALTGKPLLAALALLPECCALLRVRMLPGALLRAALLPLTAFVALDTLLARAFARRRFLFRIPDGLITPLGCVLPGAALLVLALCSARALVPLLPLSLLWLSAPLLIPALDAPTLERIPLHPDQQAQLRSTAESAFFDADPAAHAAGRSASPRSMLAACAGCMLGLLEPDEAARRVQALFASAIIETPSAADLAALLASAQYLRERMGDCDAALRALPAQIEQYALRADPPREDSTLAAFLRAAMRQESSAFSLRQPHDDAPLDAVFLPLGPSSSAVRHPLTLPLTHPHTYLRRIQLACDQPEIAPDPLDRFLVLAAAALAHPFYPLLMRSPVCAPYAPLLNI